MQTLPNETAPAITPNVDDDGAIYFPLLSGRKKPAIKEWQHTLPGSYPAVGNHGRVLTPADLVIDADPRNYPEGRDVLKELMDRFPLPPTRAVKTPRGGFHIYFRKPPNLKIKKKQTPFPGIDFLSEGQYVCCPGTKTFENVQEQTVDGEYVLVNSSSVATAPLNLLQAFEQQSEFEKAIAPGEDFSPKYVSNFEADCKTAVPAIQGSGGHGAAYKQACKARDWGVPEEIAFESMRDFWNPRCQPPWSGEEQLGELRGIVRHAYQYAKGGIGSLTPEAVFGQLPPEQNAFTPLNQQTPETLEDTAQKIKMSTSTKLIGCGDGAVFWHDCGGAGYADINQADHIERHKIRSSGFKQWLQHRYYLKYASAPNSQALEDALKTFEAKARFEGQQFEPRLRVAEQDGCIFFDLANEKWQAVKISANGWEVVDCPPVKFIRSSATRALPLPRRSGIESLAKLKALLRLPDSAWILYLGFLISCFRSNVPYPVLILTAEQGSGKSSFIKLTRKLIDPVETPLSSAPKEERDLLIAAKNRHIIAFDNLSSIKQDFSDQICRLATGGGQSFRTLYENDEETSFDVRKPVIIAGINDLATQGDLLDRSVIVRLPHVSEEQRKVEEELWPEFETISADVLGALFTAVSGALRRLPDTKLTRLPRMADFAKWVCAAAPDLGFSQQEFLDTYHLNRQKAAELSLEDSPIANFIRETLAPEWEGSASDLLGLLKYALGRDCQAWLTPRTLANQLRRLKPALKSVGTKVLFCDEDFPRKGEKRIIRIEQNRAQTKELKWQDLI